DLLFGIDIGAFGRVDNEWCTRGSSSPAVAQVRTEAQRVGPPEASNDANRKAAVEYRGIVRVVVQYGGDPCRQVLDTAPEQPDGFWDPQLLAHRRIVRAVDIGRPLRGAGIRASPEARKQIEFQVLMRVDQSRQNEEPRKVHAHTRIGLCAE